MAESVKTKKVARLLQKALADIFIQETSSLLDNMMITVTEVRISPDLGLAKVYLSFLLDEHRAKGVAKVEEHTGVFRKLLGNQVGNKLRRVPVLRFYTDDSVAHAAKINQLLDELKIPEEVGLIQDDELLN